MLLFAGNRLYIRCQLVRYITSNRLNSHDVILPVITVLQFTESDRISEGMEK